MNENTITISLDEYKELLSKAERIAVIERMCKTSYISEDIRAVLCINTEKGADDGQI